MWTSTQRIKNLRFTCENRILKEILDTQNPKNFREKGSFFQTAWGRPQGRGGQAHMNACGQRVKNTTFV